MGKERAEPTPSLLVQSGDIERHFVLGVRQVVLGRARDCDVKLDERRASRRHAQISFDGGQAVIQDLGSTNGTVLNGARLTDQPHPLGDGDRIEIGKTEIRYLAPEPGISQDVMNGTASGTLTGDILSTAMLSGSIGATLAADNTAALVSPAAEYALLRIVVMPSDGPRIVVREHGETTEQALGPDPVSLGRDSKSDVRLRDPSASRRHATIERGPDGYRIRDLGSQNHMRVNGLEVRQHRLTEGDMIRIGAALLVFKAGNRARARLGSGTVRRPTVLIPGFGGSELWSGRERLWPNLRKLLRLNDPSVYWGEVTVRGVVREISIVPGLFKMESFGAILDFLIDDLGYRPPRDLLEFAYDWRQDIRQSAQLLADEVARWRSMRSKPTERVTIIAHSMGGLVSRYYLNHCGGAEAVERVIFLGTPHQGSTSALALALAGKGVLPFHLPLTAVKSVVAGFPSLYQLLPAYDAGFLDNGRPFAPLGDDAWLPPQQRRHLETAAEFRRELEAGAGRLPVPHTSIFGYGQNTLARLQLDWHSGGSLTLGAQYFESTGDAAVLEHSAVLEGGDIHPVRQQHGALYADPDVQRRLRFELLDRPPA